MRSLRFEVDLRDAARRLIHARLRFEPGARPPYPSTAEVFLPVWTPGSYLVREFARLVRDVHAVDPSGSVLRCRKSAKNRWLVPLGDDGSVDLRWTLYARDLSVRTAYASTEGAFWDGANLCLWPVDAREVDAILDVLLPTGWSFFAGSTPVEMVEPGRARFHVADHRTAVDTPCLAGPVDVLDLGVDARPHRFVSLGLSGITLPDTFQADARAVVHATRGVFGGEPPYARYTFLAMFGDRGRGGLEHADSSVLLAPRTTFAPRSSYEDFLALIAHEYLHVWNVKRMRPLELWEPDLERESPTRLLWVAEGFTAYLDDLICLRARVTTPKRYLGRLAAHVDAMFANPGRFRLSLADSSFDAWLLLYRPDESTRNVSQNYYTNGALAAFVIDAAIRRASGGTRTLDDALRNLWHATWDEDRGYSHDDVLAAIDAAAGTSMRSLVDALILGPFDPDLDQALELFGLRLERNAGETPTLGVRFDSDHTTIAAVVDGSPADLAGLCPADEVLALDRFRVAAADFDRVWESVARAGEPLRVLVARMGVILEVLVTPGAALPGKAKIVAVPDPSAAQLAHRASWLGSEVLGVD
ncbi:MAG: hypothetical protein U1F36_18040 [Planctomycetota bacterium]